VLKDYKELAGSKVSLLSIIADSLEFNEGRFFIFGKAL
jgi:hypothetical protein